MRYTYFDIETLDFFEDAHIKALPRNEQIASIRFGLASVCTVVRMMEVWCDFVGAERLPMLQQYLCLSDQVLVSWNGNAFDMPIIFWEAARPTCVHLDLFDYIKMETGRWYKLEEMAQANLGTGKCGTGQQAVQWLREGRVADVLTYCKEDVRLLQRLHQRLLTSQCLLLPAKKEHAEMLWCPYA